MLCPGVYEGDAAGRGEVTLLEREEALSLLTVISTRAEDRRLSAPTRGSETFSHNGRLG
jgi:hypothetical protein